MSPTIKEIASLAGVSRGTVDRVIHGRPGVAPEVRALVERILKELKYEPNTAAVALKSAGRKSKLGVIMPDMRNEFFFEVYSGVQAALRHFKVYGISSVEYMMRDSTEEELLCGIDAMTEASVDAIAMQAIDTELVRRRVKQLTPKLPIVSFNSDFTDVDRLCFVGQDAFSAGRVAGQMMSMQVRGDGRLAVVIGHSALTHQNERSMGFVEVVKANFPEIKIVGPVQTWEDEEKTYGIVSEIIDSMDDLIGIYAAGGGQKSVARALADSGRAAEIVLIGHDLLPKTVEYLQQGVVNCTIAQEPYFQGYMPIEILSEFLLFNKKPRTEYLYTAIDIRIKDNVKFGGLSFFKNEEYRWNKGFKEGELG